MVNLTEYLSQLDTDKMNNLLQEVTEQEENGHPNPAFDYVWHVWRINCYLLNKLNLLILSLQIIYSSEPLVVDTVK